MLGFPYFLSNMYIALNNSNNNNNSNSQYARSNHKGLMVLPNTHTETHTQISNNYTACQLFPLHRKSDLDNTKRENDRER